LSPSATSIARIQALPGSAPISRSFAESGGEMTEILGEFASSLARILACSKADRSMGAY
jgi:hypothetical protein